MKVLEFPLARITIWLVLGILFAFYAQPKPEAIFVFLILSSLTFGIAYLLAKRNFIQKIYFGVLTFILSFSIGAATQVAHTDYYQKNNYIHQCDNPNQKHLIEVVLREKLKPTAFSQRFVAVVKSIDRKTCNGKILVNIKDPESKLPFDIGSNLQIKTTILKYQKPKNPDQFDYGQHLTKKSILAQAFVFPFDIKVGTAINKDIWYYSALLRNRIINNLEKQQFKKDELNVITALILGQQQEISPEILHDYQFAGAVHVLSVSGLHIGFIVLFFNFILKLLPKNKTGNTIRFIVIFCGLWSFAVIAGLSASVVRSVTMFTFLSAGMFLKRETNIFHTLLVSILLILIISPSFLFDVGFQLSYAALFFILWLQPWLSQLWMPKYKITKYFWDILTVSFAAQIGTFPLSIYYFHQFPGLFFITNLIILPALGIIMALGVFVMFLAAFNYVPEIPAKTLEWSIYILNQTINKIASFEQFIIQNIPLNATLLITLYLSIFAIFIWLQNPNFKKLVFAMSLIIAVQTIYAFTIYQEENQTEWIVFHSKKNTLISERCGREITVFNSCDKNLSDNNLLKSYYTAHFCQSIKKEKIKNLYYSNKKRILIIDNSGVYPQNIKPDIVLLIQSPRINLDRLISTLNPKQIIADGSNHKTAIKLWKTSCLKEKIPFHATAEKGFYRID